MKTFLLAIFLSFGCIVFASDFGAYIGSEKKDVLASIEDITEKKTIVVEIEDFTKDDVDTLHKSGFEVFAYLNVGSVEKFRSYYKDFEAITIDSYANWGEEFWVDVRQTSWQDFVVNTLAKNIVDKGADGFFLDNFDIYSQFKIDAIFHALSSILISLQKYDKKIIINGGDEAVSFLIRNGMSSFIFGVNQESVFSRIANYKTQHFKKQKASVTKYFVDYLESAKRAGLEVFVIEYAKNKSLRNYCEKECEKRGYRYFISKDLELTIEKEANK